MLTGATLKPRCSSATTSPSAARQVARQIDQILDADRRHLEASLLLGNDKSLGGEAGQGLAQRRKTRAIRQAQRIEFKDLPGLESAGHDLTAHPMRDIGCERLPEFLSALEGRYIHESLSDSPSILSTRECCCNNFRRS
jgi:hypothetical protein